MAQVTKGQIRWMSDEELRELSLKKNAIGNASAAALMAQKEILARSSHDGIGGRDGDRPRFYPLSDAGLYDE